MIQIVISGGQTGVDQAGLVAAQTVGLQTGGYAPRNWLTLDGSFPELGTRFGLVEHSGGYRERTWANVEFAEATVQIAQDFTSPGERCTSNAIKHYNKPCFQVFYQMGHQQSLLAKWIWDGRFSVLNVAGNSEQTCPGIYNWSKRFLVNAFKELQIWG